MIDRLLILGGGSDIAVAFVRELADVEMSHLVLAGRAGGSVEAARHVLQIDFPAMSIVTADFDGASTEDHQDIVDGIDERYGPFDAVLIAFGQLGEPFTIDNDPGAAGTLAHLNYAGAVSACLASLNILRGEPNARLIVLSSIAAVRPRVGNLVYGSAKAGLDAFARELAAPAKKVGVEVVVVRPGFVHTRMTEGLDAAPFATTPQQVAADMARGLAKGRAIIHSPPVLGPVGLILKNLPATVLRHLSKR